MKTNCWLIFAVMVSGSLLAQTATNQPAAPAGAAAAVPAASEPAVAAPAAAVKPAPAKAPAKQTTRKAPVKKAAAKKPTYDLKTVPLAPGPATLVASNVNVRGQAKLKSEIVARLSKPQEVRVIEEIILKNSGADEPSAWARIELPAGIHVWVHKQYIDATTKAVKPRRLNVRSGPGENYSILGRIEKDAVVKEVSTKGDWIQIEAPAGAYAFVAAQYLQQGAAAIEVATTTPDAGHGAQNDRGSGDRAAGHADDRHGASGGCPRPRRPAANCRRRSDECSYSDNGGHQRNGNHSGINGARAGGGIAAAHR